LVLSSTLLNAAKTANAQNYGLLYLSLRTADTNTYFLPADAGFNKFLNPSMLSNSTFLYEVIFKSHMISGQLLFDYYLDGQTYYTDTLLPVTASRRRPAGAAQDEITVSIGHVKGKISPTLRNIYCVSGIIHVIDSVLGIPQMTAYQKIAASTDLTIFKSLIDQSSKYQQLLNQQPMQVVYPTQPPNSVQYQRQAKMLRAQRDKEKRDHKDEPKSKRQANNQFNPQQSMQQQQLLQQQQQFMQQQQNPQQQQQFMQQQQNPQQQQMLNQFNPQLMQQQQFSNFGQSGGLSGNIQNLNILAPNDAALFSSRDFLMQNATALDQFLSAHIIVDNQQNNIYYTDNDQVLFQNGQTYTTLNPGVLLTATVTQQATSYKNRMHSVTLSV
jgi:hypothetical protein